MGPIKKKAKENRDVALLAAFTLGLIMALRSMILAKLGD